MRTDKFRNTVTQEQNRLIFIKANFHETRLEACAYAEVKKRRPNSRPVLSELLNSTPLVSYYIAQ